jgi:protein SCO1/2
MRNRTLGTCEEPAFGETTHEDEVAEFVDAIKRAPDQRVALLRLLPEQHPLYLNRGANEVVRIRGYVLAAFEQVGTPRAALPYVLEELETSRNAYSVAAAAKALRGLDAPTGELAPFLFKAVENIKYADDTLNFEGYKPRWPLANTTTALKELFITFGWLGSQARHALPGLEALLETRPSVFSSTIRTEIEKAIVRIRTDETGVGADCCTLPSPLSLPAERFRRSRTDSATMAAIELEDQDGNLIKFGDFFSGMPSVVVFFYCRCDNPNKCSLTITKLARLQRVITEAGLEGRLNTAAITYDPAYDLAPRLKAYGQNRGVRFGEHDRMLRAPNGLREIESYFDLGVSFLGSIVNRHRIELFILDDHGRVAFTFTRLQWNMHEVLNLAKSLLEAGSHSATPLRRFRGKRHDHSRARATLQGLLSATPSLLLAFFPKCPLCWAAYLSAIGITSLQTLPNTSCLLSGLIVLMLVNLIILYRRAKWRGGMGFFYISLSGVFVELFLGIYLGMHYAIYLGTAMIILGSLLNSLPARLGIAQRSPRPHNSLRARLSQTVRRVR